MADDSSFQERHYQRRGKDQLNIIQRSKRELRIRLVYPPVKNENTEITESPAAKMEYTLEVGGKKLTGTTDGNGVLRQIVPLNAKSGTLTLHRTVAGKQTIFWSIPLKIGDLEPVDAVSLTGVKARLNNLGLFASKELDDASDGQFWRAMERFRTLYNVTEIAQFPALPGQGKLKEVYGS